MLNRLSESTYSVSLQHIIQPYIVPKHVTIYHTRRLQFPTFSQHQEPTTRNNNTGPYVEHDGGSSTALPFHSSTGRSPSPSPQISARRRICHSQRGHRETPGIPPPDETPKVQGCLDEVIRHQNTPPCNYDRNLIFSTQERDSSQAPQGHHVSFVCTARKRRTRIAGESPWAAIWSIISTTAVPQPPTSSPSRYSSTASYPL